MSTNIKKIFNFFFPVFDQVYLLQGEEYSFQRFNFWFWRFLFRRNIEKRDRLVLTSRAKILILSSLVLFVLLNLTFTNIFFLILSLLLFPVYVVVTNFLTLPIFNFLRNRKIKQASEYLKDNKKPNTKIISIMGSFGKTTTKNILLDILKTKYKVGFIEGNINTPLGIANWVLKNYDKSVDIFICEVDGYNSEEYMQTTSILNPDLTILTNIGDQHLQRFGSRGNLATAITKGFSKSGMNYIFQKDFNFLKENNLLENFQMEIVEVDENINSRLDYLKENMSLAKKVGQCLGIKNEYIEHAITNFKEPERRGSTADFFGFETLDSSYNISFTTATKVLDEAVRLAGEKNKKLLVAFAGIPELAQSDSGNNSILGKLISEKADEVVFFKSMFVNDMLKGVGDKDGVDLVGDFKEFEKLITQKYDKEKYFLLLFPELTDIYY